MPYTEPHTPVYIRQDLYDKLAANAKKDKRTIKLQLEMLLEKAL